ncbi:FKBP-type peptidyl-prolyl cis-trans isomerase [Burkholderia cenocepacia]|uniref:FKBP-type peptidyl-prolyl cis-trans isomerase n=1 Tax=Burkholderia cenocepacia TaxID=95486 RepID=UPI00076137B6|nr:FKBP-type peptidyl-prolyl cis-trans isomerase [Burkholderia cenocepacia]KWU26276.1 FKBP-type peptidylprolyl isomerase [Burkholderia cenocepacia]
MKKAIALAILSMTSCAFASAPLMPQNLSSGVTIVHQKAGTGAKPSATDVVKVNYRGTLADGTEFDSSAKHGGPAAFPLNRVVKCWGIALQAMQVGETAHIVCPAATAYGDRAVGSIPANSELAFDVELLDIVKQ